ncbi:MAG: LytTR family transcriptional regulator, partial [Crocinitomicaceae bacterium]|nr:LytTR family transcriptional regulator [Crocinitomicaceae bacterium]
NYGTEYIELSEIEFIEADAAYSIIYLINGSRKMVSRNLKYFEDALCELKSFVKVHRSFIINLNHMNSLRKEDRGVIVLKSGKEINISRGQRQAFFEKLEKR